MPHFLAWRLREYGYTAQLIDAAHEVNANMPNFVLQKVGDALNDAGRPIKGSRILLLGVAYKADVADTRESPSLEVFKQLVARGGDVRYCDPHIPALDVDGEPYTSAPWTDEEVAAADCVVLLTAAPRVPRARRAGTSPTVVVDTRNVVPGRTARAPDLRRLSQPAREGARPPRPPRCASGPRACDTGS